LLQNKQNEECGIRQQLLEYSSKIPPIDNSGRERVGQEKMLLIISGMR